MALQFVEKEYVRQVRENSIHVSIMPSYLWVLWEEEYDAPREEATAFVIPCRELIEYFGLVQKQADGYYYAQDGKLADFDSKLTGICYGLVFRADLLKQFI